MQANTNTITQAEIDAAIDRGRQLRANYLNELVTRKTRRTRKQAAAKNLSLRPATS